MNNLKQMGLGCLNYADIKKKLPPGKVLHDLTGGAGANCGDPNRNVYSSWSLEILPFIDELPLSKMYRYDLQNSAVENTTVVGTILPIMTCPSDPNGRHTELPENANASNANGTQVFAVGSYKGCAGHGYYDVGHTEASWDSAKTPATDVRPEDRGALSLWTNSASSVCYMASISRSPVTIPHIKDGTSKTMLIGEYTTISRLVRSAFWANSFYGYNLGQIQLPFACQSNPTTCSTSVNGAAFGIFLDPDYGKCETAAATLLGNSNNPWVCHRTFAGMHGGGNSINFVFCDGAVHAVTITGDLRVLAALATIDGNGKEPQNAIPN